VTRFAGGGGAAGFAGDGGPATSASLRNPAGIAVASNGDLYIADTGNHAIRRVEFLTGEITTVAGTGVAGFSGDGGPATAARLRAPEDVVLSPSGDLYVADTGNHVIRMVSAASGAITRVAGTGAPGMEGNGGPAGDARLAGPRGVAMDASGSLYLADSGNNRVCRVTAGAGILVVVAGTGAAGYSGDGGPARGAKLWGPQDVALAANGDLYVADTRNHAVRLVAAATGVITTVVGTGTAGFAGDGGPAAAALLDAPTSLDVAKSGDLYVADSGNHRIRRVVAGSGAIGTIAGSGAAGDAGDGGPSTGASLDAPRGVAVSPAGPYFVTDPIHHRVRKVEGVLSVVDWLEPSA
jgi:sugar lactone lactonase YvrE